MVIVSAEQTGDCYICAAESVESSINVVSLTREYATSLQERTHKKSNFNFYPTKGVKSHNQSARMKMWIDLEGKYCAVIALGQCLFNSKPVLYVIISIKNKRIKCYQ